MTLFISSKGNAWRRLKPKWEDKNTGSILSISKCLENSSYYTLLFYILIWKFPKFFIIFLAIWFIFCTLSLVRLWHILLHIHARTSMCLWLQCFLPIDPPKLYSPHQGGVVLLLPNFQKLMSSVAPGPAACHHEIRGCCWAAALQDTGEME